MVCMRCLFFWMEKNKLILPFFVASIVMECPFAKIGVICMLNFKKSFLCDNSINKEFIR